MLHSLITLFLSVVLTSAIATSAPPTKATDRSSKIVENTASSPPGGQVILADQTLFSIKVRVLSFSPEDLAKAVSARLARLVKEPLFSVESVKVVDSGSGSDIASGGRRLLSNAWRHRV